MILKTIIDKYRFFKAIGQQIEKLQFKKINHLFFTARKHSNYYKEIFSKSGVNSIKNYTDFEQIPFLERKDLKEHLDDIQIKKFFCSNVITSGSSGEPIKINKSRESILRTLIAGHPFFISKYTGLKINKVCLILVWGGNSVEDIFESNIERYLRYRKTRLSVLAPIDEIVDTLISKKPELILTYPSFLIKLRLYLDKKNINLDFLKLILVSGELISLSFKEKHKDFFRCPILNSYISTEGGFMGIDFMDRSGMYLLADNVYIEAIKNDKPVLDQEGEIVLTELNNFATPLIRYKGLGDRGIISMDNTGKRYLRLISGRIIDEIINRDNVKICAYSITEIIESFPEVMKFKIIQESPDTLKILIKSSKNVELFKNSAKYFLEIKNKIESIFNHPIKLGIEADCNIENKLNGVPSKVVERRF